MKTVKVKPWGKDQGEYVVINEADFKEGVHELYIEGEDKSKPKPLTVDQLKAALTEKGVEIPDGAKKEDLQALLDAELAKQ